MTTKNVLLSGKEKTNAKGLTILPASALTHQFAALMKNQVGFATAAVGLIGLLAGCDTAVAVSSRTRAEQLEPSPASTQSPLSTTFPAAPAPPVVTPTRISSSTLSPSRTPWPTPTPQPSATPWPAPKVWVLRQFVLPTLDALPVVPARDVASLGEQVPISYSPPDGVDVFGNTVLHWEFHGALGPDEFFDIKIKPLGSQDSAFVDWTKSTAYELRPWSGWTPGLYTWQIGIVKGYLQGDTKHLIADSGRDSAPLLIKWQAAGHGSSGGSAAGGGGSSGGS